MKAVLNLRAAILEDKAPHRAIFSPSEKTPSDQGAHLVVFDSMHFADVKGWQPGLYTITIEPWKPEEPKAEDPPASDVPPAVDPAG